eukprot:Amastigsp_a3574_31.p4 type:complete len:107 gc:universal Amastigsp_a3574_31:685-365(-)
MNVPCSRGPSSTSTRSEPSARVSGAKLSMVLPRSTSSTTSAATNAESARLIVARRLWSGKRSLETNCGAAKTRRNGSHHSSRSGERSEAVLDGCTFQSSGVAERPR